MQEAFEIPKPDEAALREALARADATPCDTDNKDDADILKMAFEYGISLEARDLEEFCVAEFYSFPQAAAYRDELANAHETDEEIDASIRGSAGLLAMACSHGLPQRVWVPLSLTGEDGALVNSAVIGLADGKVPVVASWCIGSGKPVGVALESAIGRSKQECIRIDIDLEAIEICDTALRRHIDEMQGRELAEEADAVDETTGGRSGAGRGGRALCDCPACNAIDRAIYGKGRDN